MITTCAALAAPACEPIADGPEPELSMTAQAVTNGCGVITCTKPTCGAWDMSNPGDGLGYTTSSFTEGVGYYQSVCFGSGGCDFYSSAYGDFYSCYTTPGVHSTCNNYLLYNRWPDIATNRRNQLISSISGISSPAAAGLHVSAQYENLPCESTLDCQTGDSPSCQETCTTSVSNLVTGYPAAMFTGTHACGTCQDTPIDCLGHPVVAGGIGHTCALLGTHVQCWGSNARGQLGDSNTGTQSIARVTTLNLSGSGLQAIAAGSQHSCAINAGHVVCWGANDHGQLGVSNALATEQDTPVEVTGLPIAHAQAVTAGDLHTCAVVDRGAWCWSFNGNGQLGIGSASSSDSLSARAVTGLSAGVQQIAAGASHTCAVVSGAAKCWGDNSGGQLGIVTGDGSPPPTQTTSAQPVYGLGTGVQAVVAGLHHSCALLSAGGVKCWGSNNFGQLGNAPSAGSPPPQARSDAPVDVAGLTSGVTALVAGTNHTCALLTGGTVKCWGNNTVAQLGTGSSDPTFSGFASAVPDVSGVVAIASGAQHTCVVGNFGVKCWGSNGSAQLAQTPADGLFRGPVSISNVSCSGSGTALSCTASGL